MNNKIEELTIKKKLQTFGWKDNSHLILKLSSKKATDIDAIFIKNKQIIKTKISINTKENRIYYNYKRNKKYYLDVNWDFILFTNTKDIWILPYEYIKRKYKSGYRIPKDDNCFKNNFKLLDMTEKEFIYFLIDHKK